MHGRLGGWIALAAVAWLAGILVQLQQAMLWPVGAYAAVLGASAVMAAGFCGLSARVVACRSLGGGCLPALVLALSLALSLALAGFGSTGWRAVPRLDARLPAALEGVPLLVTGRVRGLPQIDADGLRFMLSVESAQRLDDQQPVPLEGLLWLGWGQGWQVTPAPGQAPAGLASGERWQLPVRLKRPHGLLNPHGFDAELWLFEHGLQATGAVLAGALAAPQRLGPPRPGWPPDVLGALRQRWRDAILLDQGHDPARAGLLAALVVGDQSAIDADGWELFRQTGLAHLVSISGMHITLFAWLAARLAGWVWRRSPGCCLALPAPLAGAWAGLGLAWAYALLAGWGVPAQRTVLMLALTVAGRSLALGWPGWLICLLAAAGVALADPWALLAPGYWLSFLAVLLLMGSEDGRPALAARARVPAEAGWAHWRQGIAAALRQGLAAHWVTTLGLAPLSLWLFQQVSLVGLLANLVAVPLISFVIVPLALAGVAWPACWSLAAYLLGPLLDWLGWLAGTPLAVWSVAAATPWAAVLGIAAGVLLAVPLPWRIRVLGGLLLLPLLLPVLPRPAPGHFELLAADIGQGSAVLVRTAQHALLHDTGPQLSRDSDAGRLVLLPLLQALGQRRLDELVISHRDLDHTGGAASLLDRLPVAHLRSSLEPGHPLHRRPLPQTTCAAGQQWIWDGVRFEILFPPGGADLEGVRPNTVSCVLKLTDRSGRSALLTGDLEAAQEAWLVANAAPALRSEVLLVPHHGSLTSSSQAFLEAVAPRIGVIQLGYRNRYGHPHPEVLARYQGLGIPLVRSDACGAWFWAPNGATCTRDVRRRYWHWTASDASPGAGAVVATDKPAGDRE